MQVQYDDEADAVYIRLSRLQPTGALELTDYLNVDTTDDGHVVGVEILEASQHLDIKELFSFKVDVPKRRRRAKG